MPDLRRLILFAGTAALTAPAPAQAAAPSKLTVHVHTRPAVFSRDGKVLAKQPAKPRLGDLIFQVGSISKGGKKIGREDVFCSETDAIHEICTVVDQLEGGSIVHIGVGDATKPVFLDSIVGGTGRYASATGSALMRFTGPLDATLVYTLGS